MEELLVGRPWSLEDRRRWEVLVEYFERQPYFLSLIVFALPEVPLTCREVQVLQNLIYASAAHVERAAAVLALGVGAQEEKHEVEAGLVVVYCTRLYIEINFVLYKSQ